MAALTLGLRNTKGLRGYQVPHVENLVRALSIHRTALDLSDPGCHAVGTPILMWDGMTRTVETLEVGDRVLGWDGLPKTILSLCRGKEKMARVIPVKGNPFIVNLSHILTVVQSNSHKSRTISKTNGQYFDVKVSDYLLWKAESKKQAKLFRVPALMWDARKYVIEPYHLGILLGDGCLVSKNAFSVSKPDNEIKAECEILAKAFKCRMTTTMRSENNPSYHFRESGLLWSELCRLALAGLKSPDKFVPIQYLVGSVRQRLEILAGLVDTDGSLSCGGYDYISASKMLAENVCFLARSVGLAAYMSESEKYCQTGAGGIYWRVSISGDIHMIPCRIPRKKANKRIQKKSVLRTGFKVEMLGEDDFYGFSLEGDGRFCLGDFTVTHNTGKTFAAVAVCRELGLVPAVICPKSVVAAWERVLAGFGIRPYFISGWEAAKTESFPHGTWNYRTGDYTWKLGTTKILLILDEVHKAKGVDSQNSAMLIASKAQNLLTLCLSATAADNPRDMRGLGYRMGLHDLLDFKPWSESLGCYQDVQGREERPVWRCEDATAAMLAVHRLLFPDKAARMRIKDIPGFPATQITADLYPIKDWKKQNDAFGILIEEIKVLQKEAKLGWTGAALTLNTRYRQLTEHLKVDLLVSLTNDYLENNKSVVIFVNYTETLFELMKKFPKAACIHGGQTGKGERDGEIARFQADKCRVMIANIRAGGVGVSLHDLNGKFGRVSLICPTYSGQDLIQACGRIHRDGSRSTSLQRIIYAKGTVEEEMCRKVAKRVESIQAINDGDLREEDIMGFKTPIEFESEDENG